MVPRRNGDPLSAIFSEIFARYDFEVWRTEQDQATHIITIWTYPAAPIEFKMEIEKVTPACWGLLFLLLDIEAARKSP